LVILIFVLILLFGFGCYKSELFDNITKPEISITIGDMYKLWHQKRKRENPKITKEQSKKEWMLKVNEYKALMDAKKKEFKVL